MRGLLHGLFRGLDNRKRSRTRLKEEKGVGVEGGCAEP